VELESEITNRAGIYFDFNDPVITNTVLHTVGKDFLEVSTAIKELSAGGAVMIYPNPLNDIFSIEMKNVTHLPSTLKIFDTAGELIQQTQLIESKQTIELSADLGGMYFYKVVHNGVSVAEGKLVKL